MIPFDLTALIRATSFIQRKAKTREIFHTKTLQNFTQFLFIFSTFNLISRFSSKISPQTTALQYFKRKTMAEMNCQLTIMKIRKWKHNSFTYPVIRVKSTHIAHHLSRKQPNNVPDTYSAITELIAAQHEQMSLSGTSALQYPTTPPTSLISDDENDDVLTPIIGNPAQFLPYTPNRHPIPLQLCQQITPIPHTPESPTRENCGQPDNFRPDVIPDHPSSKFFNNPSNMTTIADGLRNLTLHPHPQCNEWVTGCLVCGKFYDQVIEETVADYLNQTAQPGETVRERQIKRNAFIDGIQRGVFTFLPAGVSLAAACDGLLYSVNYNGHNSGTQGYTLPLFED